MLIKNVSYLVTQDNNRSILQDVDVRIEGDRIVEIGKNIQGTPDLDGRNKIVMPGLVNLHTHIAMTALRGLSDDKQLKDWLDEVVPKERSLTPPQLQDSCDLACQEMIMSGTTTFVDGYWPADPAIHSAKKSGLRALIFPALADFFPSDQDKYQVVADLLQTHKDPTGRVKIGIAPHSVYGCQEEDLIKIRDFAKEHDIPLMIHCSETRQERVDCFNKTGLQPVEYLAKLNVLTPKTLLVHAVWLTKGEIKIIKDNGSSVCHCPISNMKLASGGVMPLPELAEAGVPIGLGTDSVVSNNNADMFEEMKVTGLLHKHHRWDATTAPVQKILDMATIEGARCINLEKDIGSIEIGKKADIITIDLTAPHMRPINNLISNIVYSAKGSDVIDVIIDGRLVLKNRIFNV